MGPDPAPADTEGPDEIYRRCAEELVRAVGEAVGPWVARVVHERYLAWAGTVPEEVATAALRAGEEARAEVVAALGRLVAIDVEAQRTNPLSLLRAAVAHPTAVLAGAGVPEVVRDRFAEDAFPADVYGLSPAAFADVAPELADPGLVWGAAKAHLVLSRRRGRT